jgi:hypothetical protein
MTLNYRDSTEKPSRWRLNVICGAQFASEDITSYSDKDMPYVD